MQPSLKHEKQLRSLTYHGGGDREIAYERPHGAPRWLRRRCVCRCVCHQLCRFACVVAVITRFYSVRLREPPQPPQ